MKNILFNKASRAFDEALSLKDRARISDDNINFCLKAAEEYNSAQTYYLEVLKQNDLSKNDQHYLMAMQYYCEYEANECYYKLNYKHGIFDKALKFGEKAISAINKAVECINYNFTSEKNKQEIHQQRINFEFTKLCSFFMKIEPLSKKAMLNKEYIKAFDYFNLMLENQKKCVEFIKINSISEPHCRITRGNYHAMAVNVSNALCFHLISNSISNSYELKYNLTKNLIKAYLESELAFDKNPECLEYLKGHEVLKNNLDTILKSLKCYWKKLIIDFGETDILEKRMKHIDSQKYNEIKAELELENNFVKKLYLVGGFWIIILLSIVGSVAIILTFNLEFYNLFLVILLIQSLYLITAAFILKTINCLSEEGFFTLIKLAIKISFKGLNKLEKNKKN